MTETSTLRLDETVAPPAASEVRAGMPAAAGSSNAGGVRAAAAADAAGVARQFAFTGSGGEYFRIWVVNLLLSIVTLGVYSAWAKVRRLQYFYRNTSVAGTVFDYHGDPKAILKGRVVAVGLLLAYQIATEVSSTGAIVVGLILIASLPWMLARAFRFKLANSSYGGLRFRFRGTVAQAYRTLALFPVVLAATGVFVWSVLATFESRPRWGLLILAIVVVLVVMFAVTPIAHYLLKRYQHDNAYFGQSPFFFHARLRDFFNIYAKSLAVAMLSGIPAGIFGFLTSDLFRWLSTTQFGWLFKILYGLASGYASYMIVRAYLESRVQNLVWNNSELADIGFESTARARTLFWIHASNLALIMVTFGLYKPFATVRLVRYRVESVALAPRGTIDDFVVDPTMDEAGAAGQEAGEFFDFDFGL